MRLLRSTDRLSAGSPAPKRANVVWPAVWPVRPNIAQVCAHQRLQRHNAVRAVEVVRKVWLENPVLRWRPVPCQSSTVSTTTNDLYADGGLKTPYCVEKEMADVA